MGTSTRPSGWTPGRSPSLPALHAVLLAALPISTGGPCAPPACARSDSGARAASIPEGRSRREGDGDGENDRGPQDRAHDLRIYRKARAPPVSPKLRNQLRVSPRSRETRVAGDTRSKMAPRSHIRSQSGPIHREERYVDSVGSFSRGDRLLQQTRWNDMLAVFLAMAVISTTAAGLLL